MLGIRQPPTETDRTLLFLEAWGPSEIYEGASTSHLNPNPAIGLTALNPKTLTFKSLNPKSLTLNPSTLKP